MRRALAALAVGLLLGLSVPAIADHVAESTVPVTEYTMEVYSYPNFATALTVCNGSEILREKDGDVALDARIETFARSATFPSEHWNETLTMFVVDKLGQRNEVERYQWRVAWNHSNIKPHAAGGVGDNGPESSQNSQRLTVFAPGTVLRVRGDLLTLESNRQFVAECTFRVG